MSATEIRWGVGLLLFGVAASAAIGAVSVSWHEWAVPLLWGVAASCFVAGAVTLAWPWLKIGRWPLPWPLRGKRRHKLAITPTLDYLSHAYPTDYHHSILGGYIADERKYAGLIVRNASAADLPSVIARCSASGRQEELPCFWSTKEGPDFLPGGGRSADLPVDHERALIFAQVVGKERVWGRLPRDASNLFYPFGLSDGKLLMQSPGEALELGGEVELTVTFRAQGLSQTETLQLGFDSKGPALRLL